MKKHTITLLIPLILLGISLLPLISFFHPGLPITHDGKDHVVRIVSFYASLQEGNIVPRWAGNLNWGYGHPIMMFLYPFSSYVASIFRFIGFSFVDATKVTFILAYIASTLSMYLWMHAVWGKRAGFIGALLYGFAPYRFVDIYVRGAIGEHMAFVFPPLIMYFLYKLAKNSVSTKNHELRTNIYYGVELSIAFAFFILSHNAISLMFLPIIGLYSVYLFVFEANNRLMFSISSLLSMSVGFGLSSFFWIPAFFEGKYTLRNIVTAGEAMTRFVPFSWFFYSPWNYGGTATLTKSLDIPQWAGIAASFVLIWKTKEKKIRFLLFTFYFLLFTSLFIMTSASEFIWIRIKILQNFQFPWRFLSASTFIAAVIGGISISYIINNVNKFATHNVHLSSNREQGTKNLLFIIFCFFSIIVTVYMWHPKAYSLEDESSYTGIYPGTTDTGESSPIWSVRFMEHLPANPMEVVEGEALITVGKRTTTLHEYTIVAKKQSRIVENTLYFPGWRIFVDGISAGIQFQDPMYRGLMTFWIDEGEHTVKVQFTDTKVRRLASTISILSVVFVLLAGLSTFLCIRKK